ncbi:2-dehydro-3-deoxygluconokinase [Streptomyces sp. WAC 06738]|uniref:sugar kinase n=1 Tax=Streptomyces sp. WAC 06738 TaxID=2203210 RepID=UPI000F6DD1F7|nr:sugar kinase [Streptomyces sp. WAC 06738]AZM49494.1 2-dehydro-3-deoxygluconokinase [Streptomyces sp. WAC 06738]
MAEPAPEVLTCGEAMLLMLAEPGMPLARAVNFRRAIGGAESNVAAGLSRLGHRARWFGRVGADPAGEAVLAQLRADGVDVSYADVDPDAPTGMLLRDSHPQRAIDVQYYRAGSAASRLAPEHISPEVVEGARVLHLSGITPILSPSAAEATVKLVELAHAAGALVSFDPNVRRKLAGPERWAEVVGPLLAEADLLLAGDDELETLTGEPADAAAARLLRGRTDTVVIKRADHTATALTAAGERVDQPPYDVRLTDPVGAGDAFATGFLSARLRDLPLDRALAEGACVAALVIQTVTDTDGLPTAAARDRALAAFTSGGDAVHR